MSGLQLLKNMVANRAHMTPLPTPDTTISKRTIIEEKPKHKKLKEYFEALIERVCDENSSGEE